MKRLMVGLVGAAALFIGLAGGVAKSHLPVAVAATSNVTVSPGKVWVNTQFSVHGCGLKKNATTVIDMTSADMFERMTYMSDSSGCVTFTAMADSNVGPCGLTFQQFNGKNLQTAYAYSFNVW